MVSVSVSDLASCFLIIQILQNQIIIPPVYEVCQGYVVLSFHPSVCSFVCIFVCLLVLSCARPFSTVRQEFALNLLTHISITPYHFLFLIGS